MGISSDQSNFPRSRRTSANEMPQSTPRKILKRPAGSDDDMQFPNAAHKIIVETESYLLVLPVCLVSATILAFVAATIISGSLETSHPSPESDRERFHLEHNYCQIALGAVLFYEVILCIDNSDLAKILFCPVISKFVGVVCYSFMANGYLPRIQSLNGRTVNSTLCLLR